jgi:hypothetical protein
MSRVCLKFIVLSFLFTTVSFALNLRNPRDIQNWDSYAIVGDAGKKNAITQALRQNLAAHKMFRLIMPGDNLYKFFDTYASVWDIWKQEGFLFPLVAIGNHNKGYANEVAYFQMPGEYYAFESKGALFLVLNSDNASNFGQQHYWLDQALTKSQYPLNFVIYHHPSATLSGMHEWEEKKGFQRGMRAIIKKHAQKITSLIVGHDHAAGLFTMNETPLILAGASWESRGIKLPPVKDPEFTVSGLWATTMGGYWWARLDYNALTKEVYVNFNRFDKQQDVCTFRISPKPMAKSRGCR